MAEYTPVKRPSIIISYANDQRELWHIAKEYNISGEEILKANGEDAYVIGEIVAGEDKIEIV